MYFCTFLWQQGQRMALPPRGQPDIRGSWLALQAEFPRQPKARGLLKRRNKLETRSGHVGSGSLGVLRIKTAFLKGSMRWECICFLWWDQNILFFHRFVVIVHPSCYSYLLLTSLLLLFLARERLWSNSEQHCHEVQEKRQTSSHGKEQGAGPPFLLPNLAQDIQTHWLCQRWVSLCLCIPLTSWTSLIVCEQLTVHFFPGDIGDPYLFFIIIVNAVWPWIWL